MAIPENNVDITLADGKLRPEQFGRLRPSDPNLPIEVLRQRLKEDNYLFLKGLLPREHALKARDAYFDFLSPSKVLKPGTPAVDGIFDSTNDLSNFGGLTSFVSNEKRSEQSELFLDLTNRAHTQSWYTDDFSQHRNLPDLVKKLTEWKDVRLFERSMLRCSLPKSEPTGVHYDQIFLRKGDVTNITAWCAMGDIKANGGGLMYLEKSMLPRVSGSLFEDWY